MSNTDGTCEGCIFIMKSLEDATCANCTRKGYKKALHAEMMQKRPKDNYTAINACVVQEKANG